MLVTLQSLIVLIVLAVIGGIGSEQLANRKLLRLTLVVAFLVALAGAFIGWWLLATIFHLLSDILLLDVPIVDALIGAVLLLIPWFIVRSGNAPTKYSRTHQWQKKYKR